MVFDLFFHSALIINSMDLQNTSYLGDIHLIEYIIPKYRYFQTNLENVKHGGKKKSETFYDNTKFLLLRNKTIIVI